jgi:hypothetical protein
MPSACDRSTDDQPAAYLTRSFPPPDRAFGLRSSTRAPAHETVITPTQEKAAFDFVEVC